MLPLGLACLLGVGCLAVAQASEVLEVDAERRAAQVAADPAALDRLLHDRLRYHHSDGREETKAEFVASLTGGVVDYREIRVSAIDMIPCEARQDACVRAFQTLEVTFEGRAYTIPGCYVAAYQRDRGRLRLLAYRSAGLDPAGGCPL